MSTPGSLPAGDRSEPSSRGESGTHWHPAREWPEQEDDEDEEEHDSDYQPFSDEEGIDEDVWEEDEDAVEPEILDDADHGDINIEFTLNGSDNEDDEDQGHARIINVIRSHGLRPLVNYSIRDIEDEDDDADDFGYLRHPLHRLRATRRRAGTDQFPPVPNPAGTELMGSGDFGSNLHYVDDLKKRKKSLATKLMWRELGICSPGAHRRAAQSVFQDLIPGSVADKIVHYDSRCYSGQFSDDGNFFYSCAQNFKVRMYDTSNPYEWKYYKTVDYPFGQWTITDATLSPDNRFLAYTSIRNLVCLTPTDPADHSDPKLLDLSRLPGGETRRDSYENSYFGIWSLRFSGDGREIVAGTSENTVVVYDLETRQPVLRLQNHEDDVNAVCFGDVSSPHILYSGSDDSTLRVWDRRSMGDGREAGVFMGHTEGLTYIDSKGDGRYVLSNSKDQSMKLWDLRKMMTTAKFDTIDVHNYTTGYDYRFEPYPDDYYEPHPHDCSVVTFRGHRVLKTLIRCHFSPPGSSNSRYVFTGSADGKVYVYNLDATLAGTIDVGQATLSSRPQDDYIFNLAYGMRSRTGELPWRTCVRDASWHPDAPVLAATSWNGWGLSTGTCTLHSWNGSAREDEGEPPVGKNYSSRLETLPEFDDFRKASAEGRRPGVSSIRSRPVLRQFWDDDDDEVIW